MLPAFPWHDFTRVFLYRYILHLRWRIQKADRRWNPGKMFRLRGCWTMLPGEVQGHCIPTERRLGWLLPGIWKLNVTKWVTKTKSFAACSLTSTVPSCRKSLARSKSTDNGWVWRNLFFPIFTEKWRLWWGQRWIHLCDVVVSNMCGDVISKLVHHWSCWKSWQSWWKTTTPTTAKRVEKRRFDAETL